MLLLAIAVHLVLIVGIGGFIFVWNRYNYWKSRGISCIPTSFPYGCLKGVGKSLHFSEVLKNAYEELKVRCIYGGIFFFITPVGVVNNLDLVKNILVKDFNFFSDRDLYYNEKDEPLSAHLFMLDGEKWKSMRNKLSPLFATGNIKLMFPAIVKIAERFKKTVQNEIVTSTELDVYEFSGRFTTDVIAKCAFGIECDSLKEPNTEFRVQGKRLLTEKRHNKIVEGVYRNFPMIARFIGIKTFPPNLHEFFMDKVKDSVEQREKNNNQQNDFIDSLIGIKRNTKNFTLEHVAAQTFLHYFAGCETSSIAISFALYELAQHQDIQDKLRQEIMNTLEKHHGNLTYEAMTEMNFMEQVVNETLRLHPPVFNLIRKTIKDYPVPNTARVIKKGVMLLIPIQGIHLDEDYHPKPLEFDPGRFSPERLPKMHPFAFLPFGEGPRNCLGVQFGKMQIFIGLITLLNAFKFSTCDKTEIPVKINVKSPLLTPKDGVILKVEKI